MIRNNSGEYYMYSPKAVCALNIQTKKLFIRKNGQWIRFDGELLQDLLDLYLVLKIVKITHEEVYFVPDMDQEENLVEDIQLVVKNSFLYYPPKKGKRK